MCDFDIWTPSPMSGQASPLQHVKARSQRPLGFLAAKERAMPRRKQMKTAKTKRIAAAKAKAGKRKK